ncbi:hypothetical protein [Paenibacillus donghaensis]|uniref:DUF4142 domain-containing protein n=1 Tax=Paenibacillus donghaensis TaxID=414771 RepID=A0A2Z2KDJ3_9BACL|nr:hypothetical protein [Paenibacillus donghaensis]ASA21093.1 hypothetical protein B9T62_10020 [Paenibacillus donghaensis]
MRNKLTPITALAAAMLLSLSPASVLAAPGTGGGSPTPVPDQIRAGQEHPHNPHAVNKEGKFRAGGHFILAESARLLEMDRAELVTSLKAGKTLTELAKEKKGWNEDQFIQKLNEAAGARLDQAVADGRLSAADAAKLKSNLPLILKQHIGKIGRFQEGRPGGEHVKTP